MSSMHHRHQPVPRLCGLLLLLVHLAAPMQGLPLLAAAVATLDHGHRVALSGGQADVCLVLHHDRMVAGGNTVPAGHHHRGLVRLLAGAGGEGPHPDHVLHFKSSPRGLKAGETVLAAAGTVKHASAPESGLVASFQRPAHADRTAAAMTPCREQRWWPPAPAGCAWGCVVLLI
jgi:hypothetical protein